MAPPNTDEILSNAVGFYVSRAHDFLSAHISRRARAAGLQLPKISVLMMIASHPEITPRQLAQAVGRDKSTLTGILLELETRGLTSRVSSKSDGRSYGLRLTKSGYSAYATVLQIVNDQEALVERVLGKRKKREMLASLKKLVDGLHSLE